MNKDDLEKCELHGWLLLADFASSIIVMKTKSFSGHTKKGRQKDGKKEDGEIARRTDDDDDDTSRISIKKLKATEDRFVAAKRI